MTKLNTYTNLQINYRNGNLNFFCSDVSDEHIYKSISLYYKIRGYALPQDIWVVQKYPGKRRSLYLSNLKVMEDEINLLSNLIAIANDFEDILLDKLRQKALEVLDLSDENKIFELKKVIEVYANPLVLSVLNSNL